MPPEPHILVLGLNHHTAPVEVRERLALDEAGVRRHLDMLRDDGLATEAFLVSTCNRVELYAVPGAAGPDALRGWFRTFRGPKGEPMDPFLFQKQGSEAVLHLFRVASALDSLVVGEPQILGQVKEAVRLAEEHKSLGRLLSPLTRRTMMVAKRVRTQTDIGRFRVGVGNAGVDLATQIFGELDDRRAMLLGTGEMGRQVARALQTAGLEELLIANRTHASAVAMAAEFGATPLDWDRIEEYLPRVDIVIAATGASQPIIDARQIRKALRKRRYKPLFLVDLAVPRNISSAVDNLDGAYLFNVDDLKQVVEEGLAAREDERTKAEAVVADEVGRFVQSLVKVEIGPKIGSITRSLESMRQREIERSKKLLESLDDDQRAQLEALTRTLVKKALHGPLQAIHTAAREGDQPTLESLLAIWPPEDDS